MNMIYNASAGTGKTYQVTQRYEELVLRDQIDPHRILLMTFTENAAAELRMRVTHRLLKIRRGSDDDEAVERAAEVLQRLPAAPIGTIHSFCTRLLREHALEAGLAPTFTTLAEEERSELLNRICRNELLRQLKQEPDFRTFCAGATLTSTGFGVGLVETVPQLIDQAGSLGVSLEEAETLLPQPLPPISIVEFQTIRDRLNQLGKRSKKIDEAIQRLELLLEETNNPVELVHQFDQTFSGHFSYGDARTIYPDFKALKEETLAREKYRKHFPAAQAFARYVQSVAQAYCQQKRAMNAVDFNDQLLLAEALLQSGKARPVFDYVIVDEVQDTARIQYRIIQALWGPDTKLIICGDRKQSIYTWRGADPQVMPDLEKAIQARTHHVFNLQTSYRSKAPILEIINRLFLSVYGAEEYTSTETLQPNPSYAVPDEKPCVEYIEPDEELAEASKPEKMTAEMTAVAQRIQLLVGQDPHWQPTCRYNEDHFEPVSDHNAYRYSDVLILLRRTAHQSTLEQALRRAGIPYTLGGKGRGLFARQETRDVSLFLNVLFNPSDALSYVGFLRSPWIGLSDEIIAELAWSETGFSAHQLLKAPHASRTTITRYRALTGTHAASELVRKLIDETGYDAILAGLPRGPQRLANLRKVIDWLRDTERGPQTTPAAVARKLAEHIRDLPQVPEATLLDPSQNAVTIMTVHASKGLTKRVVFLPDIRFQNRSNSNPALIHLDHQDTPRLEIRMTRPNRNAITSPGHPAASAHVTAIRDHEMKNLFYVAITRARDLVVLSASIGKKPDGWLTSIEPLVGNAITPVSSIELASAAISTPVYPIAVPNPRTLATALASLPPPLPEPKLRRRAATRLAKEQDELERFDPSDIPFARGPHNAAALGSLGHAVLEQLALNGWKGAVPHWLETLRDDFGIGSKQAATLQERIERTSDLMRNLTASATVFRPEFPFVLYHDDTLIDGTIDLLCQTNNDVTLFDYKFTESDDETALANYREQLTIYRTAAERAFPDTSSPKAFLVIISSDVTHLCPLSDEL